FSRTVAGELGAKVGLAPRIFLRKLVDVLDRVDQFEDFDPRTDYAVTVSEAERAVTGARTDPDDIDLNLGDDCFGRGERWCSWYRRFRGPCTDGAAPHRQLPRLARTAAAPGGRRGTAGGRGGRDPVGAHRRRQDRGGDLPAPDPHEPRGLARHVRAVRVPAAGLAEQPSAPPVRIHAMAGPHRRGAPR